MNRLKLLLACLSLLPLAACFGGAKAPPELLTLTAAQSRAPGEARAARQSFAEHRRALDAELVEYRKWPDYPGEHELYLVVLRDLALLDAHMAAHLSVDKEIDDVDASMEALSELNRSHLSGAEQGIIRTSRQRAIYAFLLDGIGILVAIFATYLAARVLNRYVATLRRRALELEHLAIQVGHDISNPLAPIQVVMHGNGDGDPAHEKALERGRRSLARIEGAIERLSTFAQAAMPPPSPLPRTPLHPALHAAAHAAGIEVSVEPSCQVRCPEDALREICADLMGATTPAAGDVEISATSRFVRITVCCSPDGDGVGDPFDPRLHTPGAEHPGIDLRLATARRYVEACGGRVGWRRRRGQRQELWIELLRG